MFPAQEVGMEPLVHYAVGECAIDQCSSAASGVHSSEHGPQTKGGQCSTHCHLVSGCGGALEMAMCSL